MKRVLKYGLLSFLFAAALSAVALLWLLGTPEGIRWLMERISDRVQMTIEAATIRGHLWDDIHFEGVRVGVKQGGIRIANFRLRWKPLMLFTGNIAVDEVSIREIQVQDNRPEEPKTIEFSWPVAPVHLQGLKGWVNTLQVDGLTYQRMDESPVFIRSISTRLRWREGRIMMQKIDFRSPSVHMNGEIEAGLLKPILHVDISVFPEEPLSGIDRFFVRVNLNPAQRPEQSAGEMSITCLSGTIRKAELDSRIGLTETFLRLKDLTLRLPERKGLLTGEGEISFPSGEPTARMHIGITDLSLQPELGTPTQISGTLDFSGGPPQYTGRFELLNHTGEWRKAKLSGSFHGDAGGVEITPFEGKWLDGTLQGNVLIDWKDGLSVDGILKARDLNPSQISPNWTGVVNIDLEGAVHLKGKVPPKAQLHGRLLESSLHGKTLRGEVDAHIEEENLILPRLFLQGRGFDINAKGNLRKRVFFDLDIRDLSGLVPETKGNVRGKGWVRLQEGRPSGEASAHAGGLVAGGAKMNRADFKVSLGDGEGYPILIEIEARGIEHDHLKADSAKARAKGTASRHTVGILVHSFKSEFRASLEGSYLNEVWRGNIVRLSGRDEAGTWSTHAPASLSVSRASFFLSPLVIRGIGEESMELGAEIHRKPLRGFVKASWNRLVLDRANQWLEEMNTSGQTSGSVNLQWLEGRTRFKGKVTASGTLVVGKDVFRITRTAVECNWDEKGALAPFVLDLSGGGLIEGSLFSPEPASLTLPKQGGVEIKWRDFDLLFFRRWIPDKITILGRLKGTVKGRWLPGNHFDLTGDAEITNGSLSWFEEKGRITASIETASVSCIWRDKNMSGSLSLRLAEYGQLRGDFRLPLPSRLPPSIDPKGPFFASIGGRIKEKGLLTSLFPGMIEESSGDLDLALEARGTWESPSLSGNLRIAKAGAFLPAAGIRITDVSASAHIDRDKIIIESFRAVSGEGHVEGNGLIALRHWRIKQYQGSITGVKFRTIHLPELQVLSSPKLTLEGTGEEVTIHGEIHIPDLLAYGGKASGQIKASGDVIFLDAKKPPKKKPLKIGLDVRVILGEHVLVKAEGFDGQLKGNVQFSATSLDKIRGRGEIHVAKGYYSAYGVNLEVTRGRILFAGGSAYNPSLDILALRTIGEVQAGIAVKGTPRMPQVRLYSKPPMPDTDILAYMVLGHPLGENKEQANLLMQSASFLFSKSQSVVLQDQVKSVLGLDTIDIQAEGGAVARSMVTVGKYLTPALYVSYGRSLFTGTDLYRMRYSLSKKWEIEVQSGAESSADLRYKIDFR